MPRVHAVVLGDSLSELTGALRRFHSEGCGGRAAGRLEVRRGTGFLRRTACTLLRLPRSGEGVEVVLDVTTEDDREHWHRRFDGRPLRSIQWAQRGRLLERFGAYTFGFRLSASASGLEYRFERAWLLGIPLPRWLSIRSRAQAWGDEEGWEVDSRVSIPLIGELICYRGRVNLT